MVELRYISTEEISNFKEGANVQVNLLYDENHNFTKPSSIKMAEELYLKSASNERITNICSAIEKNSSTFNKEEVADIMNEIVALDPQIYYDVIITAFAMLQVKNITLKNQFIEEMCDVFSEESNSIEEVITSNEDTYPNNDDINHEDTIDDGEYPSEDIAEEVVTERDSEEDTFPTDGE